MELAVAPFPSSSRASAMSWRLLRLSPDTLSADLSSQVCSGADAQSGLRIAGIVTVSPSKALPFPFSIRRRRSRTPVRPLVDGAPPARDMYAAVRGSTGRQSRAPSASAKQADGTRAAVRVSLREAETRPRASVRSDLTFAGFRSRWTIPFVVASSASAICRAGKRSVEEGRTGPLGKIFASTSSMTRRRGG